MSSGPKNEWSIGVLLTCVSRRGHVVPDLVVLGGFVLRRLSVSGGM
jgi:hypothetical protein